MKIKHDLKIMGCLVVVIMATMMLAAAIIMVVRPRNAKPIICPNCGAQLKLVPVKEKKE